MNHISFFFDLGRVLLDFDHNRGCRQLGALVGKSGDEVFTNFHESGIFARSHRGELDQKQLLNEFNQIFASNISLESFNHAMCDIFTPIAAHVQILKTLKQNNHRCFLLSNINSAEYSFVCANYDFLNDFDDRFTSFEIKIAKPDDGIYRHALKKSGTIAEQVIFIDDMKKNTDAASALGIHSIHLVQEMDLRSEIDSLLERLLVEAHTNS